READLAARARLDAREPAPGRRERLLDRRAGGADGEARLGAAAGEARPVTVEAARAAGVDEPRLGRGDLAGRRCACGRPGAALEPEPSAHPEIVACLDG